MDTSQFQDLAEKALARIPEKFRKALRNVAIVVQDAPAPDQLQRGRVRPGSMLLGLYEGVPLQEREGRNPLYPDRIILFQQSIESVAGRNKKALADQILLTLWHEIGHHFGLSEIETRKVEKNILKH